MLLDIGVGIFLGIAFDLLSGQYDLNVFVVVGVLAALSPDVDFIYHILRGGTSKNDHRHRELLHNPVFLLVGWLAVAGLTSPTLAWLFVAGATAHFLHDSIGIGWGVQWLVPLRTDHYTFFYRVHTADKPKPPKRLVYVWPNDKLDRLQSQYGDPDWFAHTYLKLHPFALVEMVVFALALVALYLYGT